MNFIITTLFFLVLCVASAVEAACTGSSPTWTSPTLNLADVQSCLDRAVTGDTVILPAGTSPAWGGKASFYNKAIHIRGQGQGVTVITQGGFSPVMQAGGTYNWRISDMTMTYSTMDGYMWIDSSATTGATKGWRIDHMTFTFTGSVRNFPLFGFRGVTWGLIDHVTFNGNPYQIANFNGQIGAASSESNTCSPHCWGYYYWNRDLNLGSDEAVYFEDSTVDFDGSVFGADVFDLVYGGSVVVRHSTINGAFLQTHATGHTGNEYGGMKYEIYNNTFDGLNNAALNQPFAFIRSGTGVFFNNTVKRYARSGVPDSGNYIQIDGQREAGTSCSTSASPMFACNGASSYDGNIEASGWPCVGGCGRGASAGFDGSANTQTNTPIYAWNNGTASTCASGGACSNETIIQLNGSCGARLATYLKTTGSTHSNGQVDYVNNGSTPKSGYTAYTYPHPLTVGNPRTVGNNPPPSPPINLKIQ